MNAFIFLHKKPAFSNNKGMNSERTRRNTGREKSSNTCATIGFLLTLLNIAVSVILIVTENATTLLIFTTITALISLTLSIVGISNANRAGRGKAISVIGIVLNILILLAVALFLVFAILFAQACAGIFQGIFQH